MLPAQGFPHMRITQFKGDGAPRTGTITEEADTITGMFTVMFDGTSNEIRVSAYDCKVAQREEHRKCKVGS